MAGATEDPGLALAYVLGAGRVAYHVPFAKQQAVVPWASVGMGLAGYNVNTFGFNSQFGLDFMLSSTRT